MIKLDIKKGKPGSFFSPCFCFNIGDGRMQNNKELYNFLLDRSTDIADRWIETFNHHFDSLFTSPDSVRLDELRVQSQLFIIHLHKVFLVDRGLFFSSLQDWIEQVAKHGNKDSSISELAYQVKKLRGIYWEAIGEFVEMNSGRISNQEIMLWSDLVYIAFDEITEALLGFFQKESSNKIDAQNTIIYSLTVPIIPISSAAYLMPLFGEMNTKRAKVIKEHIIAHCASKKVSLLFIDFSGLTDADDSMQQIFQLSIMLEKIKVETAFIGISKQIKEKIEELEINLDNIAVYSSLTAALKNYQLDGE
ncbi:Anti-anti-sigma regulatory factor (antagonist of anti-sigma factor) [Bacillus sp. OV322]|nr:Anti-anti-sigma regulatory factor (antagonist of anti-sigma factor) [Bacillus sp. OV322]